MGEIEIGELIIEWDDAKSEANYKKHGIRFRVAARIFLDENRIDYDELNSDDEIDFSDITRMTKEELAKFRPARLHQKKSQKFAG